jgi:hypothetical protein
LKQPVELPNLQASDWSIRFGSVTVSGLGSNFSCEFPNRVCSHLIFVGTTMAFCKVSPDVKRFLDIRSIHHPIHFL